MRIVFRILLLLTIIFSTGVLLMALPMLLKILEDPAEWQAGISLELSITWLYIAGNAVFVNALFTFLALFGFFFGPGNRKAAWWLLVLPGFLGLLLFVGDVVLLLYFDALWRDYILMVSLGSGLPMLIYWISDIVFRGMNPKLPEDSYDS